VAEVDCYDYAAAGLCHGQGQYLYLCKAEAVMPTNRVEGLPS